MVDRLGDLSRFICVTQSGSYSVTVTNRLGCSRHQRPDGGHRQSAQADHHRGRPDAFCTTSGQTVTLRASDGAASYAWYSGEHTQSITVAHGGTYRVIATYADRSSAPPIRSPSPKTK